MALRSDQITAGGKPKLFIQMAGVPGSGKSTMANLLQKSLSGLVIDHDILRSSLLEDSIEPFSQVAKRAYRLQWTLAGEVMKQGFNVIIDSPCNHQIGLDEGIALAERHGFTHWYVECRVEDIDLLDERLLARKPMRSQRTGVGRPPEAAGNSHKDDPAKLFKHWMDNPCRPTQNAIIVDSSGGLEKNRDGILETILGESNTRNITANE
ncbi:Adenylyl-sulfate kinase [Paramyrothecium foliicola]|nr:Adenylyl-sulfate kinase [Paramyrothecium foliicola]